jgi:hypothetical protein
MGLDDVGEISMGLDLGLDLSLFAARSTGRMAAKGGPAAVDACIKSLEEERQKIEMFKRELPLCARLLADGKKLLRFGSSTRPVFFLRSFFSAVSFADVVVRVPFSDRGVEGRVCEERRRRGGRRR